MRGGAKEEVIKFLAASDVPAERRRRWYREWCRATLTKLRDDDMDRVAPARKPKEQQLDLLQASSGRGEGHSTPVNEAHPAKAASATVEEAPPKIATASGDSVTASTSGE